VIDVSLKTPDAIRKLQQKLYSKAKAEPTFRFYQLYDKIWRTDILAHAYRISRSKNGKPGIDRVTFAQLESQGIEGWLLGLQEELKSKSYRPEAVLRVMIPKAGGGERPLGLPTIKDRVIQTAAKLVLEPIFEADMDDCAYGYRPKRSAVDAVKVVHKALIEGYTQVVDADLSKYFDKIPHDDLMRSVALRIVDRAVLSLLKSWLKVPVQIGDPEGPKQLSGGKHNQLGTPQGGVISPLLANRYMNRYLRYWRQCEGAKKFSAKLVNYADDFVILSKGKAQAALTWTMQVMTKLKLDINETKTSVRNAREEQFDFLGYRFGPHHVKRTGKPYLGASASDKSIQKFKDSVSEHLQTQPGPWPEIRDQLNRMLVGWQNYFHYGSKRKSYTAVNAHVLIRVRNFLQRRHKVPSRGTHQFSAAAIYNDHGIHKLVGAR
jgi:RNA-directed DNA polymerase